jgi:DNA-dependent RNA polymerase auxiliary subunit epsilon
MEIMKMEEPGEELRSKINELRQYDLNFIEEINGDVEIYKIQTGDFRLTFTITPKKWLGLEFEIHPIDDRKHIAYELDTDLYKFSVGKNREIAKSIEDDMLAFLEALMSKKILIGTNKGKEAVIMPLKDEYVLVTKGKFFTSSKGYKTLEEALKQGVYQPLKLAI